MMTRSGAYQRGFASGKRAKNLRQQMGENGYQHVKQNFLLTRHVRDSC